MPIRNRQISAMSSPSRRLAPLWMARRRNLPTEARVLAGSASACVCTEVSTTGKNTCRSAVKVRGELRYRVSAAGQSRALLDSRRGLHRMFSLASAGCLPLLSRMCDHANLHYGEPPPNPASDQTVVRVLSGKQRVDL